MYPRSEALADEILLALSVHSRTVDCTLALDVSHYFRNRILWRDRDHHVHIVWHQMTLLNPALLLFGEAPEYRAGRANSDRGLSGGSVRSQPKMAGMRRADEQTSASDLPQPLTSLDVKERQDEERKSEQQHLQILHYGSPFDGIFGR
jgi:hypothetical protein